MAKGLDLKAILSLDARQFQQGIGKVQQQIGSIATAFKGAFAVGSVAMLGKSILMVTKNYEDAMARVKAVSNASRSEMQMMNDEALRLGATTRYTATQVAETLEVLTRNGFNAQKATRSLAATLQLAQANAVDLATAGNMITNTLNMFGLGVEQVQRVNDVMSRIASNTATNLEDFYDALVNAAPMAHALSISIEETAAALGSLAQRGIKGADAGTQLRMSLQKMVDPSSMKKMKALGIEIDEDIIKAEGLQGVLEKLSEANLSVSQLNEIFTVRSSKSILQLVNAVDDFNYILKITQSEESTTERMFREGVGSVRKELDVLKSVWENLLITIGDSTKGPINATIRGLQNIILSFKTAGGTLVNFATIIAIAFRKQISSFLVMQATSSKTTAIIRANKKIEAAEIQKENAKIVLSNANSSQSERQRANLIIAQTKKTIAAKKAEVVALRGVQAAWKSVGGILTVIASVVLEQIVAKLIAMHREASKAKEVIEESQQPLEDTKRRLSTIVNLIGDGKDENSLNGALRMATELFPEFADAIKEAAIAAGKTDEYQRLKDLLWEIYEIQSKIALQDANEKLAGSAKRKLTQRLWASTRTFGIHQDYSPFMIELRSFFEKQGYGKEFIQGVLSDVVDAMVDNNADPEKQWQAVKSTLDGYEFVRTNKEIQKFVKDVKPGEWRAFRSKKQDNGYQEAEYRFNKASQYAGQSEMQSADIKVSAAFDEFDRAVAQLETKYKKGSKEFNDAVGELVEALKDKTKDLYKTDEQKQRIADLEIKYPKPKKQTIDTGKESKKKTEWEKFTETLDEYPKKLQELENQLKNGAITQAEYDKEIVKLNLDTWKAIAAISDLDSKMKSLSKERVDTINTVKANVPQDPDVANAYSELVNALHDFDKKKIEIINKNEQGAYTDPSEFVDALMDLEDETYKNIASLKGLDKAVVLLNAPLKKLYNDVTEAGKANKDYAERLKKLETPNTLPPKFEGRDAQDIIKKRDQYADVVNVLNEYEKQRLKLDMQRSKKAITDEQYNKNLAVLNGVVGISLGQFRNLNEITSKLPQSLKNLYDEINNFKLPESEPELEFDDQSIKDTFDNFSKKANELLLKNMSGMLSDNDYNKELEKLALETINATKDFEALGKSITNLPQAYQDVYNALMDLKRQIESANGGKLPEAPETKNNNVPDNADYVNKQPEVKVDVKVEVDPKEVGKNINVTVDTEKDETENNDLIDEIKKWQKAVEKASKTRQQVEIEEEVGTEKIEIQLELKQDEIERIQKRIQEIYSSGEKGKDGITILTESAMKELNELMTQLKKAMNDAETLGEMKTLASGIVQLQSGMDDFAKTAIDNISNVASAFDRLMSAIESIAEAFGAELEWEGLKKVMSVINGTIQVMEALRSIIVTVQAVQEAASKKHVLNAGKEVVANAAVAASEKVKASAQAKSATAGAANSVASVPYIGAILAVAAIGAITAALLAGMNKFAGGGIVQGSTKGDKNIVRANGGELILNKAQQSRLFNAIDTGNFGGGKVEFVIRGDTLRGVLKNNDRKWGR